MLDLQTAWQGRLFRVPRPLGATRGTDHMRAFLSVVLVVLCPFAAQAGPENVDHVVIIGVDGLSPIGIDNADTPVLDRFIAEGAYTPVARAVMPTNSSPNWASMIMGAGPAQHGVLSNQWPLPGSWLKPNTDGPQSIFPTIFSILREQQPDAKIAVIHDWGGFGRLFQRRMVDIILDTDGPEETTEKTVETIREHKPTLLFVHLDHVDGALHAEGFATEPYFEAVTKADGLIGKILDALAEAGIEDRTAVIISSDHGGEGTGHGGSSLEEVIIPWMVRGPGVIPGKTIEDTVNTFDTASTAAWLLGLEQPQAWIGRPVVTAFEE